MHDEVSKSDQDGDDTALRKRLDEAVILSKTVEQLRKDLREEELILPKVGHAAFEALRTQVLAIIIKREREGPHALGLVVNRVDLTEHQLRTATATDGMNGLAATIVLRCLQKVLSRIRFADLN